MSSRSAAILFFLFAALVAGGCVDDFVGPEPDLEAILPEDTDIPWDVLSGKLAVVFGGGTINDFVVAILDAEARHVQPVMVGTFLGSPSLAPDGESIAYSNFSIDSHLDEIWSIPVTGDVLNCVMTWRCGSPLVSDPDAKLRGPAWSPDGRLAYQRNAAFERAYYVDGVPAHSEGFPAGLDADANVTWAPDGTLVAALHVEGVTSLYRIEPTTGEIAEILADALPRNPAVSPNGDLLAYESWVRDPVESLGIWVANMDGSNRRFLVEGSYPVWSPDGAWIAFVAESPDHGLYLIAPSGGDPQLISSRKAYLPSWQP